MTRRPRFPRDGVQPALPGLERPGVPTLKECNDATALHGELDSVASYLRRVRGVGRARVEALLAHLKAMVNAYRTGTVRRLASDAALAAEAALEPEGNDARKGRFNALQAYYEVCPGLSAERDEWMRELDAIAGGRTRPRDDLLDLELGGSSKQQRLRAPLFWDAHERLIEAAGDIAPQRCADRDRALMSLHLRSSLKPADIDGLDWARVMPLFEQALRTSDEVIACPLQLASGSRSVAVHRSAAEHTLRHWHARGQPSSGALFVSSKHSKWERLARNTVSLLLRKVARHCDLPEWDRRWLRAGFAVWLRRIRGWDRWTLKEYFGYRYLASIDRLMRPVEEATSQARVGEFLTMEPEASGERDRVDASSIAAPGPVKPDETVDVRN